MPLNININTGITMVDDKNKIHPANSRSRKKIWELEKTWLCSIIGTCLSMHEARKIGRKFGAKCSDPTQIDAVVHAMLVRDCAEKNQISIHVNKILEKNLKEQYARSKNTRPLQTFYNFGECFLIVD